MKSLADILLTICLITLALASCEEKELEVLGISPSIEARFINKDSLEVVNGEIILLDTAIKDINDSISTLDELVSDGDETDYSANFESLEIMKDELSAERQVLVSIRSTIESGLVSVQKISGSGSAAASDISFEAGDSATRYSLPLNVNADFSDFLIQIADVEYGISFRYTRDTVLKEGSIIIEANNVKLMDYSGLDTVSFPCDTLNCKSYEASATLYF